LKEITEFTANILLRMKIRINAFTKANNLAEFVNQPNYIYKYINSTTVRVYYELRDLMMLIPG